MRSFSESPITPQGKDPGQLERDNYSQEFTQAVEMLASTRAEMKRGNRSSNLDNELTASDYGCLAGKAFMKWVDKSTRPTEETVEKARGELRRVFKNEGQVNSFLSGFLAEYYCSIALNDAGFEVVGTSAKYDVHSGVDLKVIVSDCDDFEIKDRPGQYGNVAMSIKHVAYYPLGEQVIWPCRTLEEFTTNLGQITLRYFTILTDSKSHEAEHFARDVLRRTDMDSQLAGQTTIDSYTARDAALTVRTAARAEAEDLRNRLLWAYAQIHGLRIHTGLEKGDTILTLQRNALSKSNSLKQGVQDVDHNSQAALVLMPGQNTTVGYSGGKRENTFEEKRFLENSLTRYTMSWLTSLNNGPLKIDLLVGQLAELPYIVDKTL
jgi:hypothetical protein